MEEKKEYDSKNEEHTKNVSEPASEYSTRSNMTSMPGCCTVDELNKILDRAEKNFLDGKGITHEEAVKRIMTW